ncbi:hypothetical protein J6590_039645 [Homalodisca vitripennis]|nr:hypothetical protein J6590_039645 [Homalodisca vitripennis]
MARLMNNLTNGEFPLPEISYEAKPDKRNEVQTGVNEPSWSHDHKQHVTSELTKVNPSTGNLMSVFPAVSSVFSGKRGQEEVGKEEV